MTNRESSEDIDHAAADWAARLDRAALSDRETQDLETWASADPRRRGALARAMAILAHFDSARASELDFLPRPGAARKASVRFERRGFLAAGALAAGLGALALIAPDLLQTREYATGKGEIRSAPLADGSAIWLNSDTRVKVDYSRTRRRVTLVGGEALFDVAKDRSRPFVVCAETLAVRAVGTSFSVSHMAGEPIKVLVQEGIVDVARGALGAVTPLRLSAGGRALATASGPIRVDTVGAGSVARSLSWTEGMLDFDGATLGEAVERFARYSDEKIVIDDPLIARRTITGRFSAANPVGFAEAAALSLGLKSHVEGRTVHLTR